MRSPRRMHQISDPLGLSGRYATPVAASPPKSVHNYRTTQLPHHRTNNAALAAYSGMRSSV